MDGTADIQIIIKPHERISVTNLVCIQKSCINHAEGGGTIPSNRSASWSASLSAGWLHSASYGGGSTPNKLKQHLAGVEG